jgi:hypothetical protein
MRRVRRISGDAVKCVNLISAMLRTLVGEDDTPSPLLRQLSIGTGASEAELEVAQDIALLCADIMDKIAKEAANGNLRTAAISITSMVVSGTIDLVADRKGKS